MRSNDIIPETLEGLKSGGGHLRKQGLLLNTHLSKGKGALVPLIPQVPLALNCDFSCFKTFTENWDSKRHLLELFGLFRDYGLNYISFRNKTFLFFKIES